MALTLFEFQDALMIDISIKFTQLEKTGSIGTVVFPLRNLKTEFHFLNEVVHVFPLHFTFVFRGANYLTFGT